MAQLFTNITDFKSIVGGAVDNDAEIFASIEPDIEAAINEHLRPWVGDALTDQMIAAHPTSTAPLSILIKKAQATVAPLALAVATLTKNIRFSNAGLVRPENVPFRYQENNYRDEMLMRGYEALELLLKYLDANASSFTNWDKKDKHRSLFLKYASDFRDASSHRLSRFTFEHLRPIVDEVEFFAIEKLLPKLFFSRLKTGASLTPKEKEAIRLIQKVVANFTIEEAVRRNRVQVNGGNIFTVERTREQGADTLLVPEFSNLERVATFQNLAADRNVTRLKDYFYANISDFPLCFHTNLNGINANIDAWGYVPPPPTVEEKQAAYDALLLQQQRRVVSL